MEAISSRCSMISPRLVRLGRLHPPPKAGGAVTTATNSSMARSVATGLAMGKETSTQTGGDAFAGQVIRKEYPCYQRFAALPRWTTPGYEKSLAREGGPPTRKAEPTSGLPRRRE